MPFAMSYLMIIRISTVFFLLHKNTAQFRKTSDLSGAQALFNFYDTQYQLLF